MLWQETHRGQLMGWHSVFSLCRNTTITKMPATQDVHSWTVKADGHEVNYTSVADSSKTVKAKANNLDYNGNLLPNFASKHFRIQYCWWQQITVDESNCQIAELTATCCVGHRGHTLFITCLLYSWSYWILPSEYLIHSGSTRRLCGVDKLSLTFDDIADTRPLTFNVLLPQTHLRHSHSHWPCSPAWPPFTNHWPSCGWLCTQFCLSVCSQYCYLNVTTLRSDLCYHKSVCHL